MVDMKFRVMPIMLMNQKAGIADSGMAIAEIAVARMSRRKRSTTRTARIGAFDQAFHRRRYCALV